MVSQRRRQIDLLILALVLVGGVFAAKNAQSIGDFWHERTYKPSSEIVQLAEAAGMSDEGKRLFYRFSPSLDDKDEILNQCGPKLGCAVGRHIYILRGSNDATRQSEVVTAAHEMLHIAYSRLTDDERTEVNDLLETELNNGRHPNTEKEIQFYKSRGLDYLNETHSYVGSEEGNLSNDLENHYAQYFSDRQKVLDAYKDSPEAGL